MTPTVRAILARFNGDKWGAVDYCVRISEMTSNPQTQAEYYSIAESLRELAREKGIS